MKDLRQTKRVPFSASIEQLLKRTSDYPRLGGDDEFFVSKALNLSSGGLACEANAMIDPLSPVYLIFTLPGPEGGRRIRCDGYVAHASCEEGRCILGIHFADLSEADQAAIDAYIDSVV